MRPACNAEWQCLHSRAMKLLATLLSCGVLLMGCSQRGAKELGGEITGEKATVAQAAEFDAGSSIILSGTMTEKCPVSGCWFMLRDQTGTIKVDLKNSEFVVVEVPLKTEMIVAGRIGTNETGRFLEATAARF